MIRYMVEQKHQYSVASSLLLYMEISTTLQKSKLSDYTNQVGCINMYQSKLRSLNLLGLHSNLIIQHLNHRAKLQMLNVNT